MSKGLPGRFSSSPTAIRFGEASILLPRCLTRAPRWPKNQATRGLATPSARHGPRRGRNALGRGCRCRCRCPNYRFSCDRFSCARGQRRPAAAMTSGGDGATKRAPPPTPESPPSCRPIGAYSGAAQLTVSVRPIWYRWYHRWHDEDNGIPRRAGRGCFAPPCCGDRSLPSGHHPGGDR